MASSANMVPMHEDEAFDTLLTKATTDIATIIGAGMMLDEDESMVSVDELVFKITLEWYKAGQLRFFIQAILGKLMAQYMELSDAYEVPPLEMLQREYLHTPTEESDPNE